MIKLAIKDLMLFIKDKRSMVLTFAIPIALITLFSFAFGGAGKNKEDQKITLLLSDLDKTKLSEAAIEKLDSLKSIQIVQIQLDSAQNAIKKGNESCVLIIHKGFADSLLAGNVLPLELQYDEARDIEVGLLQQSLIPTVAMLPFDLGNTQQVMANKFQKMVGNSSQNSKANIQMKSDSLFSAIYQGMANNNTGGGANASDAFFDSGIKMTKLIASKNDNALGLIHAVAGTSVMMLLFSVVGIGVGLLDEKQEGTLKRLLYSPIDPIHSLFGKLITANIISIFQLVVMFAFSGLVFGLDVSAHLPGLIIAIVATAFACSAFGVFLASFAKSRQQVQGLSTLIILVMSAIGGSMMPLFFMPAFMQKLAVVSVNYWSIQSFYDIFWRNLSITSVTFLSRIGVLLLIGTILNIIAVYLFRKNILKLT